METHLFGGPWTVEKLDAVRAYLRVYSQVLKNRLSNPSISTPSPAPEIGQANDKQPGPFLRSLNVMQ
jgi:hypothetical protein